MLAEREWFEKENRWGCKSLSLLLKGIKHVLAELCRPGSFSDIRHIL